ncbi:carbamoyltransferase C-terminal domain-containing protein [Nocardiopsis alborubida]|uniref:Carbamoyltransferase n=1 Tax=Nocardiopsis alborubida TaxID=146802 RepID=A0A7X6M8M5_9ACTN|nr:carbamoyltransferase C-terminal domain-containing protein [Nocardiopsis alborubida]NKY96723.1 carbamoyltransferase [Nocardiopsis alborubida]
MTYILGVNAGTATYHDAAACLVDDSGTVLAYIEEERLSRMRHAVGTHMPTLAVAACLRIAGIDAHQVDAVAVGWDEPRLAAAAGRGWEFTSPAHFLAALGLPHRPSLHCVPHHQAHAASAFHASGDEAAAVLVVDGNGESESTSLWRAQRGHPLVQIAVWPQVASLGHLYEAASSWLGLGKRGAGKTMGLAAYTDQRPDPGWIRVGEHGLLSALGDDPTLDYEATRGRWANHITRFAGAARPEHPAASLAQDERAVRVAAAAQTTVENTLAWLVEQARTLSGLQRVCIAGGVGLNCAANGRLDGPVYVPPVPHDAGVALGAAWTLAAPTRPQVMDPYTGGTPGTLPDVDGGRVRDVDADHIADLLQQGKIVGVCRGRSEVGPRALGHRSFLALPTQARMRQRMNTLKRREQWRPFGPLTHHGQHGWWEPSPHLHRYMLGAAHLSDTGAALMPAVRHQDGTTRPQQLQPGAEDLVWEVLDVLAGRGHAPVLLNTSFNGPGEPLVETAAQALACANRLGAHALVTDQVLVELEDRA